MGQGKQIMKELKLDRSYHDNCLHTLQKSGFFTFFLIPIHKILD